jgi:hypothetical protein
MKLVPHMLSVSFNTFISAFSSIVLQDRLLLTHKKVLTVTKDCGEQIDEHLALRKKRIAKTIPRIKIFDFRLLYFSGFCEFSKKIPPHSTVLAILKQNIVINHSTVNPSTNNLQWSINKDDRTDLSMY